MTFNEAAHILDCHDMEYRPSAIPDHIDVLAVFTTLDKPGIAQTDWDTIPLKRQAIFDWLGY